MYIERNSKNVKNIDGVKFYNRWVVLNVEVAVIDMIRDYAAANDVTIRRAFSEMIKKAASNGTNKT